MYGAEFSYYSGKLRAYLRKKGIPFTEIPPSVWTYKRFIIPRTGVQFIPVLHTPDDEVLQDTTAIIDALEPRFSDYGVCPQTPRQRLAALLLELYGDEIPGTPVPRALGEHEFRLGDARGRRAVLPHGLWRWQRSRDDLRSLACEPREQAMKLADRLGLRAALSAVPPVRVERDANRFVTGT